MTFFSRLYVWTMSLSRHPRAPWYLAVLSFAESSFFPIPPDVMLAPMCLAQPKKAWRFAALTSVASVLGGIAGYLIGLFALDLVHPLIEGTRYAAGYEKAVSWFQDWGFWAVFVAGFSPIPYKVFTIAAGALTMPFLPFVLASFVGRGARFFLVAGLMAMGGARMEAALHQYVDRVGWTVVALVVAGVAISYL